METRLLHKCIGGVCCIAAVVLLIGVVVERWPQNDTARVTVFVDLNSLATHHPGWEQLQYIRACLEDFRAYEGFPEVESAGIDDPIHDMHSVDLAVQRRDLQSQLTKEAETQLVRVEEMLLAAVRQRVQSKAEELQNEVAQELTDRRRQEDRLLATSLRAEREDWSLDRVNEELRRIAALRIVELDGQSGDQLKARAAAYTEEQALLEKKRSAIEHQLKSDSKASLQELESLRQREIGQELDRLWTEELHRTEALLSDYKARLTPILDGQGFGDLKFGLTNDRRRAWAAASESKPVTEDGALVREAVKFLALRHRELEERIFQDIARVLWRVAEAESLDLVFSGAEGHPDYTEYFSELITKPIRLGEILSGSG